MMKQKTIGIMFGCFIPLHDGHMNLIEQALAENDGIILGVTGYDMDRGYDFIPFLRRIMLMREIYGNNPKIRMSHVDDHAIGLTGTFSLEAWRTWCTELFKNAGMAPYDSSVTYHWYTGEPDYVDKIQRLYPHHRFDIISRMEIPLSGTMIRTDPVKYHSQMHPLFWSYLKKNNLMIRGQAS